MFDCRPLAGAIVAQAAARRPEVPVVIGLAVQEIEAWMLADEAARTAAFGVAGSLDGDPEAIVDPHRGKTQLFVRGKMDSMLCKSTITWSVSPSCARIFKAT